MQRASIRNLVVLLFVLAIPIAGQERKTVWHKIAGTVVDEQEQPVAGAEVSASRNGPSTGPAPHGVSNKNGQFSIMVERLGTYVIHAENFAKGYPDSAQAFYGKRWQDVPQVTIDETSTPAPVKIKFGPKAGRLVLTILDGSTNKRIEQGSIELCRVGEPLSWQLRGAQWPKGHLEILTPEVPFSINFKTWHGEWVNRKAFDETGLQIETVQVDLGARREMTIRLNWIARLS
jgi:hypothetical protein